MIQAREANSDLACVDAGSAPVRTADLNGSRRPVRRRICVVTAGHLSTCPRMLKAADALHEAGYQVRVVSTRHVDWAWQADADVRRQRTWEWKVVSYDRATARYRWLLSGLRYKASRALARWAGLRQCPLSVAARAYARVHSELIAVILEEPVDLIYGGTTGALAAVACAARFAGVPYALDLEDFHSAEHADSRDAALTHGLAERIERGVLLDAAFLTAGSGAIAAAYRDRYGVRPTPINNTFRLPDRAPDFRPSEGPLRLYWFSQTIGPGRGLEDAVRAMGLGGMPGELHVRGRPSGGYIDQLRRLASEVAPRLAIVHHSPLPPDEMIDACRPYDVGLAVEQAAVLNRAICLTNKIFTYLLAGLAVAVTDTPGQRAVALDLGQAAALYQPGDIQRLAAGLRSWHENRELLAHAKRAAWERAADRWHWDHPCERGALLECFAIALQAE